MSDATEKPASDAAESPAVEGDPNVLGILINTNLLDGSMSVQYSHAQVDLLQVSSVLNVVQGEIINQMAQQRATVAEAVEAAQAAESQGQGLTLATEADIQNMGLTNALGMPLRA